jgi:hypothetical protein
MDEEGKIFVSCCHALGIVQMCAGAQEILLLERPQYEGNKKGMIQYY